MRSAILVLVALIVLVPVFAESTTWRVELHGGGDFFNIQDAMPICAPGDTILIGSGRFDLFQQVPSGGGWMHEAILGVTQEDLTFIGSGSTNTIIGPTSMYDPGTLPEPSAVVSSADVHTKFIDVGFEYSIRCLDWAYGGLEIVRCRFNEYKYGVYAWPFTDVNVIDSRFDTSVLSSKGVIASGPPTLLIANCEFSGPNMVEAGIYLSSATDATIRNCHFATNLAMRFGASTGSVTGCTTDPATRGSVICSDSNVQLFDNVFYGDWASLYVTGGCIVYGSGNIFSGGTEISTIYISTQSEVTLNNNHIFKTGDYAAKIGQYFYGFVTNDLTGNYWGTDDPDLVAEWIWDNDDDPTLGARIEFLPLADGPVPTEEKSFGSIKAMFR